MTLVSQLLLLLLLWRRLPSPAVLQLGGLAYHVPERTGTLWRAVVARATRDSGRLDVEELRMGPGGHRGTQTAHNWRYNGGLRAMHLLPARHRSPH